MTEPRNHHRAAHRAGGDGLRNKSLLWAVLAGAGLLTATGIGLFMPGEGEEAARVTPTPSSMSPTDAEAEVPVVVGPTPVETEQWIEVLGDPVVDLGRPADDAATRGLISRALRESQQSDQLHAAMDEAFRKRARTEGDMRPVLAATERLDAAAREQASPSAEAPTSGLTVATDIVPVPTHTVVTRSQWDAWRAKHPETTLVASTPGDQEDVSYGTVSGTTLQKSLDEWARLARPFHALVALDVSGSMGDPALPDGTSRIDMTASAAGMGVSMFPEHDQVGAWIFSRNVDGARDYREMAPVAEMAAVEDGVVHREQLMSVASQLRSTGGDTGLYDTTLAAYRQVLADDAPDSLKTVIILTDGMDNDPGSIGLQDLLERLREEQDPDNPVRIITVGISEGADAKVLQQISEATGGTSHIAREAEDIQGAFMRALTET